LSAALAELRAGRPAIGVGEHLPPFLIAAAAAITPESLNSMVVRGRGPVMLCLSGERCDELGLATRVSRSAAVAPVTAISAVDSRDPISIEARARAIAIAADPGSSPGSLREPGFVPVMRAADTGVSGAGGWAEFAIEIARLASAVPAAVVCPLLLSDGSVARPSDLDEEWGREAVPTVDVEEVLTDGAARLRNSGWTNLPIRAGTFRAAAFEDPGEESEHLVMAMGEIDGVDPLHARVMGQCFSCDVLRRVDCDCGCSVEAALQEIASLGRGVLLYLTRPEARLGSAPVRLSTKESVVAARIFSEIGVRGLALPGGHPDLLRTELESRGIQVTALNARFPCRQATA
jgi:3,4-dihydroxy 2-butanone 4-phosphate synthase/GTP cyclohydrolase II